MKQVFAVVALALAGASMANGQAAQPLVLPSPGANPFRVPGYSSSEMQTAALPDAPADSIRLAPVPAQKTRTDNRPFHGFAIAAKIGTGGIGFDVATPLASFINLRTGAQLFDHVTDFKTDGIVASGDITLQNIAASVDIYPFHGSFRISPGVTIHNDNHLTASLAVPGGQAFSLGDTDYTSDPNDPIIGIARLKFGNTVAPRLTAGWGNMLKTSGHWSVPVEVGFEYTSQPTLDLVLLGSACDPAQGCAPIGSGTGPQDLASEVSMLQQDLQPLRFFPILSVGLSYRFGHVGSRGGVR